MVIQDDRTAAERATHTWLVVGTDRFMSGWGCAKGGVSVAAWAVDPSDWEAVKAVREWVGKRGDMSRVRETTDSPKKRYSPKGRGHCHIYVVRAGHPALARLEQWRADMDAAVEDARRRRDAVEV